MASKEALIAADWWVDTICAGAKMDNGDNTEMGDVTRTLSIMLRDEAMKSLTLERVIYFKSELIGIIDGYRNNGTGLFKHRVTLSVDYGPDCILGTAVDRAGINPGVLPYKTAMIIANDSVKVGYGYRAPFVELIPKVRELEDCGCV